MSKKDKKIKLLKKELKELRAELRRLKSVSVSRIRTKMANALGQLPKTQAQPATAEKVVRPRRWAALERRGCAKNAQQAQS